MYHLVVFYFHMYEPILLFILQWQDIDMHIRPLTPITCHMATECDTILLPCTMPLHYTSLCKLRQKSLGQGLFLLRPYPSIRPNSNGITQSLQTADFCNCNLQAIFNMAFQIKSVYILQYFIKRGSNSRIPGMKKKFPLFLTEQTL